MKVFKSKLVLQFSISKFPKPAQGDVVFFLSEEWDYIKNKNPLPLDFKKIWDERKLNCHSQIIPDEVKRAAAERAKNFSSAILEKLRGKNV